MTPASGTIIGKRFRLVRELACGNMGSVWLADHLTLDMQCAVKLMSSSASLDARTRARFQREAKAIAQLHSPHVVRVIDYDVDDDTPFIAMELLEGEELGARIYRLGRLDASATHRIVAEVARGLTKAHAAGIVHRDLKPENIFLARVDDGDGELAKLVDFGIAKAASLGAETGTLAGAVLGTPHYMSPEQVRGAATIDHRADLWSLAVVTYQCLLGRLPFDSPTLGDVFAQILVDPIPVPSHAAPKGVHIPPAFDRWWARAVSRDVAERFSSAQELSETLGKALGIGCHETPDMTMAPVAVSWSGSGQVLLAPARRPWRLRFVAAAGVAAVSLLALTGYLSRGTGAAVASQAPWVAMDLPPTPPPERDPRVSSSHQETAPLRTPDPAVHDDPAGASATPDPDRLSRPAAQVAAPRRTSGGATRRAPAPGRPGEDVDFGI